MSDQAWFELMHDSWSVDNEDELVEVTYVWAISRFLEKLQRGQILYSTSFPLLCREAGRLAIGKFPDTPLCHFRLFVKVTSKDSDARPRKTINRIECRFGSQPRDQISLLKSYGAFSPTETMYMSEDIMFPEASVYESLRETVRIHFAYDDSMKTSLPKEPSLLPSAEVLEAQVMTLESDPQVAGLTNRFTENLKNLLKSGEESDVTFKFGFGDTEVLPAHKLFLKTHSDVFKAMFSTPMQESALDQVTITDFTKQEFEIFLHYLYTGTLPKNEAVEKYLAVLRAAQKYAVPILTTEVTQIIADRLNTDNAVKILFQAQLLGAEELITRAHNFITAHNANQALNKVLKSLVNRPELLEQISMEL